MDDTARHLLDLKSSVEEVRRQAVKALGESRNRDFLEPLVEALGDPSWRVRKEASEAVLTYNNPDAVKLLLPGLRDPANAGRRNSVVETVIHIGLPAVPEVARLLEDQDPDVRKFSVDILGGMDFPEVIPLLIKCLADDDSNVVAAATEHLGQKGDRKALGALMKLLSREEFLLKFSALRAVGQLAGQEQEEDILTLCKDATLRLEAMEVLSRLGTRRSFGELLASYSGWGKREKMKVLHTLTSILARMSPSQSAAAVELVGDIDRAGLRREFDAFLCRTIREVRGAERRKAIRAAAVSPSPEVLEALVSGIDSSEEEEREDISGALTLFPDEYLPALFTYLNSDSTLIRRKMAWVFGHHRFRPALPRLLPLVRDEDGHVRASVAVALGHLGDKSAVMPLCGLLQDAYPDVRQAAVEALTEMAGADEGLRNMICEIIVSSLAGEKEPVTEGSLQVLGNLSDGSLIPVFTRFLKDARIRVRKAALQGLGRLKTGAAFEIILSALADEDPDMRMETIRYLGQSPEEKHRQAVIAMVEDEDNVVASEALRSLGAWGDERSLILLQRSAREAAGLKQLAAVRALAGFRDRRAWEVLAKLLPAVPVEARREIINAAARAGDRSRLEAVLPFMKDADWSVRLATVEAVEKLGDGSVVARVRRTCLPGEEDFLVKRALESLPGGDEG